ncbi:hypothetical protein PSTT_00550, partial [Puccinia striiformis]
MSVIIREPLYNGLLEGPRSQRQVNAALATAALLQLPQCQHLMVYDIWTPITNRTESSQLDQQPARNSVRRMMNTFESLEVLMSFFEETIPTITQLDTKLTDKQPLDISRERSSPVSRSSRFRVSGMTAYVCHLVSIFEMLRESLEGLLISHKSAITHVLNSKFPKLRGYQTRDEVIANILSQDLFAKAPIQLIALDSHTVYCWKRPFLINPFAQLSSLKKLVFLHACL